ncbi:odd Oz/ten-m homolog 4 [Olavius algarvensis Delta 1 endosymbiont]|nr:odd Oz/ten-m homolog 4 [Olavius algarvensis Delta 1 endosymbiont]
MIKKVSVTLSLLLLVCVVVPPDNYTFSQDPITAPSAKDEFKKGSRLERKIDAKKSYWDPWVYFQFHEPDPAADADDALAGNKLTIGSFTLPLNDTVPAEDVNRWTPAVGALVEENSTGDRVVTREPEDITSTVNTSAFPAAIESGEPVLLSWDSVYVPNAPIDPGIDVVNPDGSISVAPDQTTAYNVSAASASGSISTRIAGKVLDYTAPQPPGHFGAQYEDLVPPDGKVDQYDPLRFSLVTGVVHDLNGTPLADVLVTVHGHLEYGTVVTDPEGRYSIPVEGGATVTVVFQKEGLFTAHRRIYVPWNNIAIAATVQLITQDPISTTHTFDGDPATVVTHRSSPITDEFGSRSATLVFTGDNRAFLMDKNGHDVRELSTITTRATEFTTPESMPAELPPNSAYTYCMELSVDGAQRVRFDKPIMVWINNFLRFDVGMAVPFSYYGRDKGLWLPADNGKVVRLLDTDLDGITDALDADADDQPDDLNNNGSFRDEVLGLENAQSYKPGSTFWRVAVTQISPWNFSWPYGSPWDAIAANAEGAPVLDAQCEYDGPDRMASCIEAGSRIFREDISIPGTDIALNYASDRVKGYRQVILVPASGDTVPVSLKHIITRVEVAGRRFEQILNPLPDQVVEFIWDGRDHLGRSVRSPITAVVSVGFAYNAVYLRPGEFAQSFGQAGTEITNIVARRETIFWKRSQMNVAPKTGGKNALAEGWTITNHHQIAPSQPWLLFKGDGTTSRRNLPHITTIAGSGTIGYSGDGGPATAAKLSYPVGVDVDAGGNLYIAEWNNHCVRMVNTSGVITTVAGNGFTGYSGDGGPATAARLNFPYGVVTDRAGNIYIADGGNHRIRMVDTDGIITTVAGSGESGYSGDGGPAIAAQLHYPSRVDVDNDGNLYIVDRSNRRIRKVDNNGIITTVAGSGLGGKETSGEGGPAVAANLANPLGLAVDAEGNIYISDWGNNRIYKVNTRGFITTVAGSGTEGDSGDGAFATTAWLANPLGVAVDATGAIYIADSSNYRIRKVNTGGFITTVAGIGESGYSGDGDLAIAARLKHPYDVAVDAAGNLYIADHFNQRIRKVAPPSAFTAELAPGEIPFAENSGLGYIFSSTGLHQKTFDLDSGVILRLFDYDEDDRLQSITDQFGNTISIERDAGGVPSAIISPDGIRTELTIDADNHLTRVTYPDDSYYRFEYTPNGLMTTEIEPAGNRFEYDFSHTGRLTDAYEEHGGHWNYQRTTSVNGDILTQQTTGEGNVTSFVDRTDATGACTTTITGPAGSQTLYSRSADGLYEKMSSDSGLNLEFEYDADSEYKYKFIKQMTAGTPSGLSREVLRDKTYQDTNADDVPDIVTTTIALNGKSTTLEHHIPAAEKVATSPEGRTVTSFYDPDTLLTESVIIPGLYDTEFEYDAGGRLTRVSSHTRQTDFAYYPEGWLASVTDAENRTTGYRYDALGRVTEISRPDGSYIDFDYDANGNMTVLTNPMGIAHGFGFNSVNRNSSYQTPLSGSYSNEYDKDRRLIQTNFPSGNAIVNDYADPANPSDKSRLWQIMTSEENIDFNYLCGSQIESISKGSESIAYSYDGELVTSETLDGTLKQSIAYTYNNDFNPAGTTYAGETVSYSYDNDGLVTGAGSFTIWRNADNGLAESVTGNALDLARTFNGYGEVDAQSLFVSAHEIASWSLTRDNNSRIASKTETLNSVTAGFEYTYDSMGRLLTVVKDGTLVEKYRYGFDGTRNYEMNALRGIAGRSFSYSDEDHLLTAGSVSYDYDPDGFLTTKTDGIEATNYTYSSRGELLSVSLPDGRVIEYEHDPLGRRIAKTADGVVVEEYLWQGLTRLLAIYDGADNLLMRFEYADERMPVAMNAEGVTFYLAYDQVGSLRLISDSAGNVMKSLEYDSFGNVLNDSNPAFAVPFGFAGGLHDRDTGLVRFGHRDYDPDVGRWTAKDPMGFAGGDRDLYGYVLNNPINSIDPLGSHDWSYFHGNSGKYRENKNTPAYTISLYTVFNKEFDEYPRWVQGGIEYHKSLHQRKPWLSEGDVWRRQTEFELSSLRSQLE